MSAKLRPLVLPQLVQERKRLEDGPAAAAEMAEGGIAVGTAGPGVLFLGDNASVSDITSPATPTFSHRSGLGHLRYSSSSSSLDLPLSLPSPSSAECPAPPAGVVAGLAAAVSAPGVASLTAAAAVKRPLPDVQEEDLLERVAEHAHEFGDDYLAAATYRDSYLYGCLCDEPCTHGHGQRDDVPYSRPSYDYDLGFVSDCEPAAHVPSVQQRHRHRHRAGSTASAVSSLSNTTHDSAFSGLTLRFGSHIHALSRWRSKSTGRRTYANLAAPASEPSLSRAPSSRSSSLSAGRPAPVVEPVPMPVPMLSPALSSYYGSTESIEHFPTASSVRDMDDMDEEHASLERDRIKASTPLLPPLYTADAELQQQPVVSPLPPPSLQTSPLQTPALVSPALSPGTLDAPSGFPLGSAADAAIPAMSLAAAPTSPTEARASPPLRRKFSTASFHVPLATPSPPIPTAAAAAIPGALEPHDEWCDRLGHANYTVLPKPYTLPEDDTADTQALHALRDDWMLARTNYAKHLVRTGEHYGTTSNTYALTEAKWAETDREWQRAHDAAMAHVTQMLVRAGGDGRARAATLDQLPPLQHHNVSCVIPQILDNAEGKFPGLGDEDIVGPMDRVACMEREDGGYVATAGMHGEKNGMSRFLRGLAIRVRSRK